MKKICNNCNNIVADATPEETHCPECGGLLRDDIASSISQMEQRGGMQMDNSIHKGDNIGEIHHGNEMHVSGDNAGNIDKSTTINNTTNTTSNTTNYTVYQPKDEGREMVTCEYSGANVYLSDTFKCKKCGRRIDKKFYIEEYNCCKECSEKEVKNLSAKPITQTVIVPSVPERSTGNVAESTSQPTSKNRLQSISVNPDIANIPYTDTSRINVNTGNGAGNSNGNSKRKYAMVALAFTVICSAGFFAVNNNIGKQEAQEPAIQEEVQPTTEVNSTNVTATMRPTGNTEMEKATDDTTTGVAEPEHPDYMAEGESAYNNKEYSRAKVLLQSASDEGKAAADYYLAMMYANGMGVSVSLPQAFAHMRKAAEGGEKRAFFPLAEMYRNGDGTEANRALARKWYEQTVMHDRSHAEEASEILEIYE